LPRPPAGACALPLDDVVDLEDRWRAVELDATLREDRHQARTEGPDLLHRIPDLADAEPAVDAESHVVVQPGWRELARRLNTRHHIVVLPGRHAWCSCEADKDAHVVPPRMGA